MSHLGQRPRRRTVRGQSSTPVPAPAHTPQAKTPVHQWTNEQGEVLILRFAAKDGTSYGGFKHPLTVGETVTAPDWDAKPVCGGGIHGWAWGIGLGEGKDCNWAALWQVYGVLAAHVIGNLENGIKCKFRTGTLRYLGDWHSAMMFVLDGQKKWVEHFSDGTCRATGYSSASSATGYSSASSATGDSSASSATGYSSASSATGDSSASSATGDSSASSATGYRSASSATGEASAAVAVGLNGRARAGEFGCIALAWWNSAESRSEMRCALTGSGKGTLKANVWYELDAAGNFVEAEI